MAIENLIPEIEAEIARLTQVRNLLAGTESPATKRRGRPAGVALAKKPPKRVMSPEARERIAAAQRKRWAKQKKAAAAKQVAKAPAKRAKKGSAKKAAAKTAKPVESSTAEKKGE
jgi:hypothetical protein